VYGFCETIGLPTTLTDLGLQNAGRTELMPAAEKTCAPGECIHHEAGVITPENVLSAMIAADAIGQARKKNSCRT
jgi:glycerol dehydrogenase